MRPNIQPSQMLSPFAARKDPSHSEAAISLSTITPDEITKVRTPAPALSEVSSYESNQTKLIQTKKSSGGIRQCCR